MDQVEDRLIDTPWGKKRWSLIKAALELYNKQQQGQ